MKTNTPPPRNERRMDRHQRLKHAVRMAHDPMFVDRPGDNPVDDVLAEAEDRQEVREPLPRDRH